MKRRDSTTPSARAIREIEAALGDIGRGTDFPMARSRGGSTSSRTGEGVVPPQPTRPPPPVPPIPAEHRQPPQLPGARLGDDVRLPADQPAAAAAAATGAMEAAAPSSVPGPPRGLKYSLFPPPFFPPPTGPLPPLPRGSLASAASLAPSGASGPSASTGQPDGPPQLRRPRDLEPCNPHGYPAPPAFGHNWAPPNLARARHAHPTRPTSHRAGPVGPPVGSRPREHSPDAAATTTTTTDTTSSAAAAMDAEANLVPPPFPPRLAPSFLAPPRRPAGHTHSASTTLPTTGQFAYYPVMSPYEAEVAVFGGFGEGEGSPRATSHDGDEEEEGGRMVIRDFDEVGVRDV
ncbi:hypothetical protein C8A05DRAFT_39487 [Staphylotrichum tortipilum]|uniref:Uncharacterized protein n=1 Tax=Staphylotrichum tortipilum TaxID=2831512 RepID=A0AAN6MBL1_9PEZI|nr:hypothetical protein C8A05DRAFT_39487 [Staphylotrichum longicolle]